LGYIKTDEFWHIQSQFRYAIENVESYYAELNYVTKVEIIIPFKWHTKIEMVEQYLKFDRNVFDSISWTGDFYGQKEDEAQKCIDKFNALLVPKQEGSV
jgi:hypothetical protein